jgi:hypothetical protein
MPHPANKQQFIQCLPDGDYVIMNCPDGLVFNKYLDRCDYNTNPVSSRCLYEPCQNGGKCVDLYNYEYRCDCPQGFYGKNCEEAPNPCGANTCDLNGVCHAMPIHSPIPFYCSCFQDNFFGLRCSRDLEQNPCKSKVAEGQEAFFSTKLDPSLFIHCDGPRLHLKACSSPLVFSKELNRCDWPNSKASTNYGYQTQTTYAPLTDYTTASYASTNAPQVQQLPQQQQQQQQQQYYYNPYF